MNRIPLLLMASLAPLASTTLAQEKKAAAPMPSPPAFERADAEKYGTQLATYADRTDQGWVDEISKGTMTLFDAGGDSVVRSFVRMRRENREKGDRNLIRFTTPAEIKGVAALTHENSGATDDNWLYLPSSKRVRRISGANNTASFQGTEFTYEDLSDIDPAEYEWRFLSETNLKRGSGAVPVYKLAAVPTYADTGYSRLVLYIHREHWRQERVEYFDKAGRHLKTRESTKWHAIHDRFWRPYHMEMKNLLSGKRTLLVQPKLLLNMSLYKSRKTGKPRKNLSEELFTTRALKS